MLFVGVGVHDCTVYLYYKCCECLALVTGLVTLDEMKARREDLVREHEKQLAAQLKASEEKRLE